MDYSIVFAFTLLAVALALIVAELFLPSGGIISLLSIVCLGASIYSAYDAWWGEHANRFWWFIGSIVGLIPATVGVTLFLLSRTRLGSRVLLQAPKLEEVTPYSQEAEKRKLLVGKTGKTQTLMAPGGLVMVDGTRHHAETEGQMLDPGQPIKIIAVKGNRVVVRPYEPASEESLKETSAPAETKPPASDEKPRKDSPEKPSTPADFAETTGESSQSPLDFEIPDS